MYKVNNFPIFIVGMPRSATILLSNLEYATNEIYFSEETHSYQHLANSNSLEIKFTSCYTQQEIGNLTYTRNTFPTLIEREFFLIWFKIVNKILNFR